MNGLRLKSLRKANRLRLPHYRNARGRPTNCSKWILAQWMNAITGELGEAANIVKKIDRGDYSLAKGRKALGKEFADILTYLDIAADKAGIDLGEVTVNKFNEVSKRVGSPVRL